MDTLCFASFLAPNVEPAYRFIADYVGSKLGISTELITGRSPEQFVSGEADIGFLCSPPYIRLKAQNPKSVALLAAPILQGERYENRPIYFSDVIVHRDSHFHHFEDLRGCSWAYNEPDSLSGYVITLHKLVSLGETNRFFGRVVAAGFHQKAIRMVAAGEVDAAAIDSQVLAIELQNHPELTRSIRVIDSLGPNPIQPMIVSSRVPETLKADVKSLLLTIGDDPVARSTLTQVMIDRFVEVHDHDYDVIRTMIENIFAAGLNSL